MSTRVLIPRTTIVLPQQRSPLPCAHRRGFDRNNPPHDVNVIIEVPVGGEPIKYEMDKEAGTVVDRFLYTAMRYPGNYGFHLPHTLSGDGDPCDVLVANTRAIVPCSDERASGRRVADGKRAGGDEKIIAVLSSKLTQRYDKVKNHNDLPDITLQIQHSSSTTRISKKGQVGKGVVLGDADEAYRPTLKASSGRIEEVGAICSR